MKVSDPPDEAARVDAADLGGSATRGAVVTLVGQFTRMLVQLGGIVVLARLLAPEDYGLTAMVAVIIGLGEMFRDFGLSSAAIQSRILTRGQRNNLFWTNTGIGVGLALLVCALSGLIAFGFGDPRLQPLTMFMSITFVLNGLSTQYRADLARHLRFTRLTVTEIAGQLAGVAAGITLAALGAGYWAIGAQQVAQGFVTLVVLVAGLRWLPGRIDRTASIRSFLGYGSSLLGAQLLGYLVRNIDTVVVGRLFGPVQLGFYNRSFQLVMLPLLQIQAPSTRVALPVLARIRDQKDRFADFLDLGQIALLSLVGLLFSYLFAQAPSVIAVGLGDQWEPAVPLFRLMLITGMFQAASYASYWVVLAQDLTKENLRFALVSRPIMAALIAAGAFWGTLGVAVALAVATALCWPATLIWLRRVSDARTGTMFVNGLRTLLVAAAAAAASWGVTTVFAVDDQLLRLGVGLAVLLGCYGSVALVWPRYRHDLRRIMSLRRHLRRSKARAA